MLNNINLMGRLTRDPELRYTQSKVAVANFTLAVDRNYGEDKQTDYIDCIAWRGTAEFISKYFFKGLMAVVSGHLQIRDWTDKEGGKRRSAEVVVDNIYFGESKRSRDNSGTAGYDTAAYAAYAAPPAASALSALSDTDGELPF